MNTHDIELPPFPSPFGIVDPDGTEGMMQYATRDLQDYAKFYASAAIEADRKRRGEPSALLARIAELEAQLEAIGAGGVTQGQPLMPGHTHEISGNSGQQRNP